jgi:dipeptidyl aminopeptidase/acylaminoacyl peptidase
MVILLAATLQAQVPTSTEALSMARPSSPSISPDGQRVAYVLSRTNWEDNAFEGDLYLAEIATGTSMRLTAGRKSSSNPTWSPDGKYLAFLSNRDGKQQIYVLRVGGGEAYALTDHATGITDLEWKAQGHLYFLAPDEESAAAKERKKKYGDLQVVEDDYTLTHAWRVPFSLTPKQKSERLTEGAFHVMAIAPTADDARLALVSKRNPDLSTLGARLEILDLKDKSRRLLAETRNGFGSPVWSPDHSKIALTTSGEVENSYYANTHIAVLDAAGGELRNITPNVDEQPQIAAWTGQGILFTTREKTSTAVYTTSADFKQVRRLSLPAGWIFSAITVSASERQAAFLGGRHGGHLDVYTTPLNSFEPKALTDLGAAWAKYKLAKREVVRWKSQDGTEIEGVLMSPAVMEPGKKYPLLVAIHGGPTGIDVPLVAPDSIYPLEQFVAKGAIVLRPNYRGSAGYGAKFRALNVRNLGVGDAWDVLSGVDALVARGIADPQRVGTMGWSQGGYISAFLATAHAERFRAISVGAGISNWVTYYVNTDIHPFTRQYLEATPWDDMEIYRKTSPMTYIKQAKAPVLIQHGDNDRRVPPPNAYELYQGLKDVGVPARLVVYKGFGHGINKPKEALHVLDENWNWFEKYVLNTTGR